MIRSHDLEDKDLACGGNIHKIISLSVPSFQIILIVAASLIKEIIMFLNWGLRSKSL